MKKRFFLMATVFIAIFVFGASLAMHTHASGPLTVEFTADPTVGLMPLEVYFQDNSSGAGIEGRAWYFGDDNLSANAWVKVAPAEGADWSARYGHSSVVLTNGDIILMGGIKDGNVRLNDIWKSTDGGETWVDITPAEEDRWPARLGHSSVLLPDGKIILMGGNKGHNEYLNDVWMSDDNGVSWVDITPVPEDDHWTARSGHSCVVLANGNIILMGGRDDGGRKNDIWKSTDGGATWEEVEVVGSSWIVRENHSSVVLPDDTILLIGGSGEFILRDVWRSDNKGINWKQITIPAEGWWERRHGHTSVVLPDGSIVLMGGYSGTSYLDDAWVSRDKGNTWTEVTAAGVWTGKQFHSSNVMPDGSIVLMGGTGADGRTDDVWALETAGSTEEDPTHIYEDPGVYTVALRVYTDEEYDTAIEVGLITVESEFAGGEGTAEEPWQIETAEQLNRIRNYLGSSHEHKYFELADDIDLENYLSETGDGYNSGAGWDPIGDTGADNMFWGNFDGKGHTISNLYVKRPDEDQVGLFGRINHTATIQNVRLVIADVAGASQVGILLGRGSFNDLNGCHVEGTVTGTAKMDGGNASITSVGGLVGYTYGGLTDCSAEVIVTAEISEPVSGNASIQYIGGLAGYTNGFDRFPLVDNCYTSAVSSVNVVISGDTGGSATVRYIGGIAGQLLNIGAVDSNSATTMNAGITGDISGSTTFSYIGGLAGRFDYSGGNISDIVNCQASGDITAIGGNTVGGLIGLVNNAGSTITASSSVDNTITGNNSVGGLVGRNEGTIIGSHSTSIVNGHRAVGGLVGVNRLEITGSYATGDVTSKGEDPYRAGGLVGENWDAKIIDSYATGNVEGVNSVGGLVGSSNQDNSEITDSWAEGNVSGRGEYVGGLVGRNSNGASISRCHAEGNVIFILEEGEENSYGGLVGSLASGTVIESYALGNVTGHILVGGLVGHSADSVISDSYAAGSVTGTLQVGGLVGMAFNGEITNCYAVGAVSETASQRGGLIGHIYDHGDHEVTIVTSSYYDTDTTGQDDDTGKGIPRTTKQMQEGYANSNIEGDDIYTGWNPYIWKFTPLDTYPMLHLSIKIRETFVAGLTSGTWYLDHEDAWHRLTASTAQASGYGDMTGDGKKNLVLSIPSGIWYIEDGDWVFVTTSRARTITFADVTGDGEENFVAGLHSGTWYLDGGDWHQLTPSTAQASAYGDMTGDGENNLVLSVPSGTWYIDGGDWVFLTTSRARTITFADVTGDSEENFVAGLHSGTWYLDGDDWHQLTPSTAHASGCGDMNDDGEDNLVLSIPSGIWYIEDGDWVRVTTSTARTITFADMSWVE